MPMLSATIPTGPTTVPAEKDLMATAETALVTATFMYCLPFHLPGCRQKVEVNKSCAVPLVRSYLVIIYNNNVNKISIRLDHTEVPF